MEGTIGQVSLFEQRPEQYPERVEGPKSNGARVEIFDPPLCCPTGLCGPALDPVLLDVNEMVLTLKEQGVSVERYLMAQQPQVFINNPQVFRLIQEQQLDALPITTVDGQIIKVGDYPTLEEVHVALNGGNV